MKYENIKTERAKRNTFDAVNSCRSNIMDIIEFLHGDEPHWENTRAKILRAFGDRGLTARLIEIIDTEFGENENNKPSNAHSRGLR